MFCFQELHLLVNGILQQHQSTNVTTTIEEIQELQLFKVQLSLYNPFQCHNFQMNVKSAQVDLRSLIKAHNLNILQICICPSNRYTGQTAIEEQQHGYVTE